MRSALCRAQSAAAVEAWGAVDAAVLAFHLFRHEIDLCLVDSFEKKSALCRSSAGTAVADVSAQFREGAVEKSQHRTLRRVPWLLSCMQVSNRGTRGLDCIGVADRPSRQAQFKLDRPRFQIDFQLGDQQLNHAPQRHRRQFVDGVRQSIELTQHGHDDGLDTDRDARPLCAAPA